MWLKGERVWFKEKSGRPLRVTWHTQTTISKADVSRWSDAIPFSFEHRHTRNLESDSDSRGWPPQGGTDPGKRESYSSESSSALAFLDFGSSSELEEEEPDETASSSSGAKGPLGKHVLHTESNSASAGSISPKSFHSL